MSQEPGSHIGRQWLDLVTMLAWRDIRIKYKQSIMGFLWAILMPALVVGAGLAVQFGMSFYSGRPVNQGGLAATAVKSVPWAFFVASIRFATGSLIGNSALVTRVYLPREVFPVAAVASQFADFCIAALALAIILAFVGVGASIQLLWIPVLVGCMVAMCLGLGMLLSAGALFFRDVKYLVEVVITFAVFFTPVFYPVDVFGPYAKYALLNPVAPLIVGFSDVIVAHRSPQIGWIGYACAVSVAVCVTGYFTFRHLEPLFAERI